MMETLIKGLIGAFKCGKERVVQKEAAGRGGRLLMVGEKKDRLSQRNCDLRKRGRIVRDGWKDFGLNPSIFIPIVNL